MTYINDKTYWTITDEGYKRDSPSAGNTNENLPGWTVVEENDLNDVVGNRTKNLEETHNYMEQYK